MKDMVQKLINRWFHNYWYFLYLKVLSHWRRRRRDCRDWSVAATRATRETTKWLALSPRRLLGDVSRGDNQFARKSRGCRRDISGSRGDVSETSSQLRGRLRQLRPYLIGLETRWRLESPLVAETSRVSGESREIQTCSIFFFGGGGRLFPVSSRSRRRLRDVSETCWRRRRNVSSVSLVSSRSLIPAGDWKKSPKNWTCFNFPRLPGDPASLQETSRRLESPTSRHLVSRPVR